jgi:hypothetical protein
MSTELKDIKHTLNDICNKLEWLGAEGISGWLGEIKQELRKLRILKERKYQLKYNITLEGFL